MPNYLTLSEWAESIGISLRFANNLAPRVPGAKREIKGHNLVWLIPEGSPKPPNLRKQPRLPKL